MFRRILLVLVPLLLLAFGVAGFIVLSSIPPELEPVTPEPPSYLVGVKVAEREPVRFEITSQGTVTPKTTTNLVSEVSGHVIEISSDFVPGGFFEEGEVLVKIDPRNYELAEKRAKLNVARARTKVETEAAMSGVAIEDWERFKEFNELAEEAAELTLRRPQTEEVQAELETAEAELIKAMGDLERTNITSPYSGLVLETNVDVGQFVNVGAQLARTVATNVAEVRLPLSLSVLEYLDLPDQSDPTPINVMLSAQLGSRTYEWPALIVRTEGVIDTQARVIYAVAQVLNPYELVGDNSDVLRFGMFVQATIQGSDGGDLFVVPRHAIYKGDQLWVVTEEDTIEPRKVSIVRSDESSSYVSTGLENGEVYCVTPIDRPIPGMKVKISH